jgi:hypothetical protein
VPEEDADLVIIANVQAKELRFDVVPNPTVEFPGKPRRETEWSAERTNLPQQVQPGVTYRDIGIRLKIVSRFADIERIVAEALGEIPASDDAPRNSSTINTEPDAASARAATGSEVRAAATPNETAQPAVGSSSPSSRTGGGRVAPKRKARAHGARRSG